MENKIFLNRYRLSLGRNGSPVELHRTPAGVTYRAQEIDSGREVALELMPYPAPDASRREQLSAEARAAKQINHINIPVLYNFGIDDDQLIYATEYFDGPTAEAWIKARGPLAPSAVLRVALQVVSALGAAAFHRIHHRALNPANVVFVPGQTTEGDWPPIKVLHLLGHAPTFSTPTADDPRLEAAVRFASPEQLRDGEVDFRSEIFSLGATMWYLLTGAPLAVGQPPVEKLRGVPKIVRHLLGRMVRLDPNERPQDPVVLAAYLQTCLGRVERREAMGRRFGFPVRTRTARAVEAATPRSFPRKPLVLAATLLICALWALIVPGGFLARPVPQTSGPTKQPPAPLLTVGELRGPVVAASAPPVLTTNSASVAVPRQEMTAPPAEGPADNAEPRGPEPASEPLRASASETRLPTAPAGGSSEEPALLPANELREVAHNNPLGAPAKGAPQLADAPPNEAAAPLVPEAKASVKTSTARKADVKKNTKRLATMRSRERAKSIAKSTRRSESRARNKRPVAKMTSEYTRATLPLRIGSSRAQLVGTTADGKWILSVASSGRRIIVPPPPGFDQ